MKSLVLILGFLSLTACSSLITRGDLKDCKNHCQEQGSCMMHIKKDKGQVQCECSEAAPAIDEKAIDQEIKETSDELEKALNEEVNPVEIPAQEQEIVPAAPEVIAPVEVAPTPVQEEVAPIKVEDIKMEAPAPEVAPVVPEEVKPEAPKAPDAAPESAPAK
jgi:hypothetical protein